MSINAADLSDLAEELCRISDEYDYPVSGVLRALSDACQRLSNRRSAAEAGVSEPRPLPGWFPSYEEVHSAYLRDEHVWIYGHQFYPGGRRR